MSHVRDVRHFKRDPIADSVVAVLIALGGVLWR